MAEAEELVMDSESKEDDEETPPPLFLRLRKHLSESQCRYIEAFPLHSACSIGSLEEIQHHIEKVHEIDSYGNLPLYWAVKHKNPEVVKILIAAGADVHNSGESKSYSPLHLSIKLQAAPITKMLIDSGADVAATDKDGLTPLHFAVQSNQGEVLQLLLRSGADPNAADFKTQDTPLHLACDVTRGLSRDSSRDHPGTQDAELVRLLVGDPRTDCLKQNASGMTPLHVAASNGNVEAAQDIIFNSLERAHLAQDRRVDGDSEAESPLSAVLNAPLNDGRTALHVACAKNESQMAELLISFGADVNAQDMHKNTPLHITTRMENPVLLDVLLSAGASVAVADHEGASPLHVAVTECRNISILHTFLIFGADPNVQEVESNMTPAHLAASTGNLEALEALLQGGANVNLLTVAQQNTLHQAVCGCHSEICKHFVTDRLHKYSVCTTGVHPTIMSLLLAYDVYIDHQDNYGFTPLHLACRYGLVDAAQIFVNAGANLTLLDHMGYDAFMSCRLVSGDERKALFNLIFRAGYVPTCQYRERMKGSAMAFLIKNFDENNVRLLIQCGYDIYADKTWRTEVNASIHFAENPPEHQEDEDHPVRLTSPEELEALRRIQDFLEAACEAPPSLWLLSRAAIRSHILKLLQTTDGSHGQRDTIWTRIELLPVPDTIRAWLKLDPTKYNDPE